MGEKHAYVGARGTWVCSELPTQFSCEPKTALKNKVYFLKWKQQQQQQQQQQNKMGEKHQENENHEDKVNSLHVCVWKSLSHVQLFATPWTVTCQAPLSMKFSRPEY